MTQEPADDWSPAKHLDAITSSQMQWWQWAALQTAVRMRDGHGPVQQVDARFWIISLHMFREAALIGADAEIPGIRAAIDHFDAQLPTLAIARHIVVHSRQYLAGRGNEQKAMMKSDPALIADDVAKQFVHISYNPAVDQVRVGLYVFAVEDTMEKVGALQLTVYGRLRAGKPGPSE